jgi:hypothetical protein
MMGMPAGLSIALTLSAQVVAAAPSPPGNAAAARAATPAKEAQRECTTPAVPDPNSREIVVCAVKPDGYRIDPDLLAARRLKKQGESVAPRNPHETYANHSCATVGPMGCRGQPTIDVFTAVAALAAMGQRLSSGQAIGPMFKTRPAESEYQLYLEAKKQREAEEIEKAAKAKAAAAQAAADAQHTGAVPTPVR